MTRAKVLHINAPRSQAVKLRERGPEVRSRQMTVLEPYSLLHLFRQWTARTFVYKSRGQVRGVLKGKMREVCCSMLIVAAVALLCFPIGLSCHASAVGAGPLSIR